MAYLPTEFLGLPVIRKDQPIKYGVRDVWGNHHTTGKKFYNALDRFTEALCSTSITSVAREYFKAHKVRVNYHTGDLYLCDPSQPLNPQLRT